MKSALLRFLRRFVFSFALLLSFSPALANAQEVPGVQGQFCQFACRSESQAPTTIDYEGGSCAPRAGAPADVGLCQRRCDETCARRGGTCDRAVAATCATVPVQWNCSCPCRARGAAASAPITNVVSEEHACGVTSGVPSADACRSTCAAVCGQSNREFVNDRAPTCQAAAPPRPADVTATSTEEDPGLVGSGSNPIPSAPSLSLTFPDPLGGNATVNGLVGSLVRIMVGLVGVLFVAVFMWSGFLYLTAGGDTGQTKTARGGMTNAVLGLVVVMLSYVMVSFVIETIGHLQGGGYDEPPAATRPAATQGRSSTPTTAPTTPGGSNLPTPGSPDDACRRFYNGDPRVCVSNGSCPSGVTNFASLLAVWGRNLLSAPSVGGRAPSQICRACIDQQLQRDQGRFSGLDETCVPAITNYWRVACSAECSGGQTVAPTPAAPAPGAPTPAGGLRNVCDPDVYNTRARDAGSNACNQCITYWMRPEHEATVAGVPCAQPRERAAVWCGSYETRARHESPGYCNVIR